MTPAAQRLGIDLGSAVSGSIPIKVIGKIGDNDSRVGVEADLTSLRLDNILPGWVKVPGKSGKATFSVVKKEQSTLFQDIVVEGGGVSIKGSLEVDQNGDLLNANFPTYCAVGRRQDHAEGRARRRRRSEGHDARRRVRRSRLPQVGDLGQGDRSQEQVQAASTSTSTSSSARWRASMARRCAASIAKLSRRNGIVRNFTLLRQGRTRYARRRPICGAARRTGPRTSCILQTNDAGAFFRFTDMYSKVIGGQLASGAGATDGRTQRQGGPDQRPRFFHQGRGFARSRRRRRFNRHSERHVLFGACAPSSPGRMDSSRSAMAS